jgi:alpha-ribazole phosphatase
MRLWLVRHARPVTAPGLCYGRLDVAVDEAASERLARQLAARWPPGLEVRHSPAIRCRHAAQVLAGLRPDLPNHPDDRLQEMDFGRWEGRSWLAIGGPAMQAWSDDFEHHRPGGGESVAVFLQRVAVAFDEVARGGTDQAWITHAGVIRAVHLLAAGRRRVCSAAEWPSQPLPFGHVEPLALA